MFKRACKRLKSNAGYTTILFLIMTGFFLPFFLFYFVEIDYLYGRKDQFQGYNDAVASATVMQIVQEKVKEGVLEIDPVEAERIAKEMTARNYLLNDDLTTKENSLIKDTPVLKVYVVNQNDGTTIEHTTPEGYKFAISHPTVIVYTEVEPKGIFYNQFFKIKSLTAYEIFNQRGVEPIIDSTRSISSDKVYLRIDDVVNPSRFHPGNTVFPKDWRFSSIPMVAGGNIQFSLHSADSSTKLNGASFDLRVESAGYSKILSDSMTKESDSVLNAFITLPEDAPKDAKVNLEINHVSATVTRNGETSDIGAEVDLNENGEEIGYIEANIQSLIGIQKVYQKD